MEVRTTWIGTVVLTQMSPSTISYVFPCCLCFPAALTALSVPYSTRSAYEKISPHTNLASKLNGDKRGAEEGKESVQRSEEFTRMWFKGRKALD